MGSPSGCLSPCENPQDATLLPILSPMRCPSPPAESMYATVGVEIRDIRLRAVEVFIPICALLRLVFAMPPPLLLVVVTASQPKNPPRVAPREAGRSLRVDTLLAQVPARTNSRCSFFFLQTQGNRERE